MASVIEPVSIDEMKMLLADKELTILQLSKHIQKLDAELEKLQPHDSPNEEAP